jgi:hypothetical protein
MCHSSIEYEQIKKSYEQTLNEPRYEIWNETSLGRLYNSASGSDGLEIQILAIQILKGYYQWYKDNNTMNDDKYNQIINELNNIQLVDALTSEDIINYKEKEKYNYAFERDHNDTIINISDDTPNKTKSLFKYITDFFGIVWSSSNL